MWVANLDGSVCVWYEEEEKSLLTAERVGIYRRAVEIG